MAKSHRPTPQHLPKKRSGGGMLLGLFLGLVVGVLIAFGVVWYLNKTPLPFMDKGNGPKPAPAPAAGAAQPNAGGTGAAAGVAAPAQPVPLPGKPGDKVGEKPRFDFYGILEGKPQAAPGQAAVPAAPPAAPPVTGEKPREVFFLQVGAFQKAADADNLKAKMAMSGVEASVQEVSLPEKGTLHRVRVGPMHSPDDMNRVRKQLADGGIQATVIKQKD